MKCGLEIHQRLEGGKLFCNCAGESKKEPEAQVLRRLHPVASELGEVDIAAQFEALRERDFSYQVFEDASCLVELDEEPPHALNEKALDAVLEAALLLKASAIDEIQVMRKIVIDGSNTSGFQRTAVVALNGRLETSRGSVGVPTVCIEEESAGIVGEEKGVMVYRLDRLGIPLVEIATDPVIESPEHAREAAEKIGLLLRATGKVMRGIGTIRQDINVSVEGGARVEIKGAQDLDLIAKLVENEVRRQEKLIEVLEEAKRRFCGKVEFEAKPVDVSGVFPKTQAKILKAALERGEKIFAARLPKLAGLLGRELQPGRRFGSELADYARAAGVKGIIHSDEDFEKYAIGKGEEDAVRKAVGAGEEDAVVLVAAGEATARKALAEAVRRAKMGFVPEETRRANADGTSSYMRPLPGKARMYPETDIPPVRVDEKRLARVRAALPKPLEERKGDLLKALNPELAEKMIRSRRLALFEKAAGEGCDAVFAATTIEETLKALKREGVEVEGIGDERLLEFFREFAKGLFVKAAAPDVLKRLAGKPGEKAADAVKALGLGRISGKELERLAEAEGKDFGRFMAKYRLRVDAGEAQKLLKKGK